MKSSTVLLSGVSMALAGPLVRRDVDVVVEVVTNVVTIDDYYTVTVAAPADTTTYAPPPPPVTTSSTEVPVVTVTVGAPADTTTYAPPPPPVTTSSTEVPVVTVTVSSSSSEAPKPQVAAAVTTSSTTSTAASATYPTDMEGIAVYHHNIHRANSSASDLTYDSTYASYAATLAARCVFEHDVTIGNPSEAYGQNIAMYAATDIETLDVNTFLAQSITNMWYNNEIELYPNTYGSEPDMTDFEGWGHYSQVVWKGSQVVGCAVQKCAAGTMESSMAAYFSVCNYFPAGNVQTEYGTNVGTPLGDATVSA